MDPQLSPLSYVTLVARRSPSVRAGVVTVRRQRGRGWAFRPAAWRRGPTRSDQWHPPNGTIVATRHTSGPRPRSLHRSGHVADPPRGATASSRPRRPPRPLPSGAAMAPNASRMTTNAERRGEAIQRSRSRFMHLPTPADRPSQPASGMCPLSTRFLRSSIMGSTNDTGWPGREAVARATLERSDLAPMRLAG